MYATTDELLVALRQAIRECPTERETLKAIAAIARQHGLEAGIAAFTNWRQKQALNAPPKSDGTNKREAALREACEFLQNALHKGPRPAGEVTQEALDAGISSKTLYRARQELNVSSVQGKSIFERLWMLSGVNNENTASSAAKPEQKSLLDTVTTEHPGNLDDTDRLKNWLLNYCHRRKVDRAAYRIVRKCSPVRDQSRFQPAFDCLESQGVAWKEKKGQRIFVRVNPIFLQHQRPRKTTLLLETESDAQNATCPPEKKHVFFHDKEVTGLALMVKNDGTRIYLFEKSVKGRKKHLTLGDAAHWTLEDARAQAKKLTVLACQGVDLQTVKSSVKPSAAPTLPKPDDALTAINNHQPDSNPPVTTLPQAEVEKAVYRVLEACFRQMAEFFKNKVTHV